MKTKRLGWVAVITAVSLVAAMALAAATIPAAADKTNGLRGAEIRDPLLIEVHGG